MFYSCVLVISVFFISPLATVLVLRGCLEVGSHIISGTSFAKVRAMSDSSDKAIKAAYPGMAVTVSGWKSLPGAGQEVLQGSEADVKKAIANRIRKAEMDSTLVDVEAINIQRQEDRERREQSDASTEAPPEKISQSPKELRIIIKGDVSGSVEAVAGAVQGIGNKEAVVKIVSTGVGDVSESDVMMAKASEGADVVLRPLSSVTRPLSRDHYRVLRGYTTFRGGHGQSKRCFDILVSRHLSCNGRSQGTGYRLAPRDQGNQSHGRSNCAAALRHPHESETD